MKLEEACPGQRVAYVPLHADGDLSHPDVERGTVSSVGRINIFVKFDRQVILLGWSGTTSQSCSPESLVLLETPRS